MSPAPHKAVAPQKFPVRAVAALFLERQWLDRPRGRRLTAANLQAFVSRTCGLQIDSINVIERAHHLTLWSRFGPYDRARLAELIYERRVLFEYLTHVACFVATRDLPSLRYWMESTPERWHRRNRAWLRRSQDLITAVEGAIRERGPLGNADFERPGGGKAGGWWSWKPATHALDYLWKCGRIAVRSRTHFQKRYDLTERVLPARLAPSGHTQATALRERLLRSLSAMGAATMADLRNYWTWPGVFAPEQRAALDALLRTGEVLAIAVEGHTSPWYVRTEELPSLQRAARARRPSTGTTLLSPFDSFLWHRERTHRLFGYFYRIEVYVPSTKRQHGYYSLPLLHDGLLIGRIDAKNHREDRRLEVRHAHFEDWFAKGGEPPAAAWGAIDRDEALAGTAAALRSLAKFVGADQVEVTKASPRALLVPLKRALKRALHEAH